MPGPSTACGHGREAQCLQTTDTSLPTKLKTESEKAFLCTSLFSRCAPKAKALPTSRISHLTHDHKGTYLLVIIKRGAALKWQQGEAFSRSSPKQGPYTFNTGAGECLGCGGVGL